jgi:predicted Zn-dependent peptidase
MIARIDAVTAEDVKAAAHDTFGAHPWSLAVVGPAIDRDLSEFVS